MEYKNRIADKLLRDKLEAIGAESIIYMDDPVKQEQYKQMA